MEIKVKKTPSAFTLIQKVTFLLFGIFITSIIFAVLLQTLGRTGLYIGLLVSIILIFCGFYYIKKNTRLRIITWGILLTVILGIAFYLSLIISVESIGEKILE